MNCRADLLACPRKLRWAPAIALVFWLAAAIAAEEPFIVKMPYYDDLIVVPVTIDGEDHEFVLDSGASLNVYDQTFIEQLGEPTSEGDIGDANGQRVAVKAYMPPVASLGTQKLPRNAGVVCLDLTPIREATGRNIKGILGIPFFAAKVIRLDFDLRQTSISNPVTEPRAEWGTPVDVAINKRDLPTINADIGDHQDEAFVLDTGMSGSLRIPSGMYSNLLAKKFITEGRDIQVAVLSGFAKQRSGALASFSFGGRSHKNLRVHDGADTCAIGLGYLRRNYITFDLGNSRIFFAAGFNFDRPDQDNSVGMRMLRKGADTEVSSILGDSAAARAGIRPGDKLISVDGSAVAEMPIAEIKWHLESRPGAANYRELKIVRDGVTQAITLQLKE